MFCFGFLGGRSIIIAALKILLPSDGIDMFYAQRYIFVLFSFLISGVIKPSRLHTQSLIFILNTPHSAKLKACFVLARFV